MIEVSVIIPMYNAQDSIIRAVNSVLYQTYNGTYEIIVINDGSTDNSLTVLDDFIKTNRINTIIKINKENGGVSSARNAGLKIAKGIYIAFLDSDDEWLPAKIQTQLKILDDNKDIDLIGTTISPKKVKRFFFKKFSRLTTISVTNLIFKNFFQPSTVIFKSEILNTVGLFPEDQKYAEEGNFFFKASSKYKCVLLNEKYINYGFDKPGFGGTGLSGNLVEMQKGEIRNLKFAYKEKYINLFLFCIAFAYSYIKYLRRIILVKSRRKMNTTSSKEVN